MPFVHVDDVVSAFVLAGRGEGSGVYNVVGERVTQKEAFDMVCEFMGVGRPMLHASPKQLIFLVKIMNVFNRLAGRRPKLVEAYIEALATERAFDTSKARGELGWEPRVGIREGIREMVEYYKISIKHL